MINVEEFTDQGAPWWSYREKDAWYDFETAHPGLAEACKRVCNDVWFSRDNTTDEWLTRGGQIQVLELRVACLLGFTSYDWDSVDRYATWWLEHKVPLEGQT